MKHFFLITNSENDTMFVTTKEIENYIRNKGATCSHQNAFMDGAVVMDVSKIPDDVECVMVLGGDGTLIKAARELINRDVSLIGINYGNLGYLAEVEKSDIFSTIDRLIEDDFTTERRMMLSAEVIRAGEVIHKSSALNDVVISKSGTIKVLKFKVYVNGQFIYTYSADGFIASTPTGSTAYNLSAGGPIVEPCASSIVLTPVSPHSLISRSIVLSADSIVEIEMCRGKSGESYVYYDGDDICNLLSGDRIVIKRSEAYTRIVRLSDISFFETLQKKMSNR